MRPADLWKLAFLFLARRRTRTFLTVLGVVIGTICIILMLSIGVSNYEALQDVISARASVTEIQITSDKYNITGQDIEELGMLDHAAAASPVLLLPGTIRTGRYEAFSQIRGVESDVLQLKFAEGSMFSASSGIPQLVVGGDAVRDFIDTENPPDFSDWELYQAYEPDIDWLQADFTFQFGYAEDPDALTENPLPPSDPVPVRVAGLTQKTQNMEAQNIYMALGPARQLLMQNAQRAESMGLSLNGYNEAIVRADSMENVAALLEEIRELGFVAYSDVEYIEEMRLEQNRQLLQLLLIGLVSLLVSAIGIANTMYAGILERRKDIGVLKVLGMKKGRILRLFLAEAAMIGLLGGVIGLLISWVSVWALNTGMSSGMLLGMYFDEGTSITIPGWVAAGAVLTACLTGILAGQWPAAKAARMSALEAMRTGP